MLKLLIIWRELPNPHDSSTSRIYHLIKNAKKYDLDITLLTFRKKNEIDNIKDDVLRYCNSIKLVDKPQEIGGSVVGFFSIFKNFFYVKDISFLDRFAISSSISLDMRKNIKKLITTKNFDLIYIDGFMLHNSLFYNNKTPMILDFLDPVLYPRYQLFKYEKNLKRKLRELLLYYRSKFFEVTYYKNFDACILVAQFHEDLLNKYLPEKRFIVPYGVDTDYFKPENNDESFPSIIFTGRMDYLHNVNATLYFCNEIYPIIKSEIPKIKFYIVGKYPTKEIIRLKSDKSIIVTGSVKDIRPYISKSTVVIAPMITDDGGFKLKILEAMAMGKPIVSTTIGAREMNLSEGKNIVIADNPKEFAKKVLTLINDEQLASNLSNNARKFVEENYSWPRATDQINKVFNEFS